MPIPAAADPADQRRQPDPKITGDLALRAPAGLRQANRFLLKSLCKPSLLGHRVPHSSSGTLHFSEASPIYRRQIVHKEQHYPGEHEAVIDEVLWNDVQAKLAANAAERKTGKTIV